MRNKGINFEQERNNAFAENLEKGHKIDPRAQKIFIACVALVVLYFVALIIPKDILNFEAHQNGYSSGYTFSWFVSDLMDNINSLLGVFMGQKTGAVSYSSTMIRYIMIALTGAGMALCGAVYQGSFKNALVSPSTLGVMSGATLGMMIWVVFFVNDDGSNVAWLDSYSSEGSSTFEYLISNYSLALLSFVGCLLVVAIVVTTMKIAGRGNTSPIFMIITGQVIGSVLSAVSTSIRYYYLTLNPYSAKSTLLTDLQIASFYRNYTWIDLACVGIPLVITFCVVMALRRRMNLLSFSQGEARTMGVDTGKMQVLVIGLCTLLTAIIISFCGQIGFVGFLVPHLARRLVGPHFSYLLPASTVIGAIFVLAAYTIVLTTVGSAYETMVGMYISIGGAVVFLITAIKGNGGARGQFA